MQEVTIVVFVAKGSVSKDRAEKGLIRHDNMLNVLEIFILEASRLPVSKIPGKVPTDDEPLGGCVQVHV